MDAPRGSFYQPVDQLAHNLLAVVRDNPALLRRKGASHAEEVKDSVRQLLMPPPHTEPWQSMQPAPASDADSYFGQLLSIAMASAERAEDAWQRVTATSRSAKRAVVAVTGFAALGVLAGIAGVVDNRLSGERDARLAAVANEVHRLADAQRQANEQFAAMQARTVEHSDAPAAAPQDAATGDPGNTRPTTPASGSRERSADQQPGSPGAASPPAEGNQTAVPAGAPGQASDPSADAAISVAEYPAFAVPSQISSEPGAQAPISSPLLASHVSYAHAGMLGARPLPSERHRGISHRAATRYGNPVRDFRRFVVAMGHGFRTIFY
jgi:hypothetical protein